MHIFETNIEKSNTDTASFYLTARLCDQPKCPDNSEIGEDSGWVFTDVKTGSVLTPQDIVVCHGLPQLKALFEEIDSATCFYPGFPVPSSIFEAQSEFPPWEDLVERFWYELLGRDSESAFVFPEQRALVCFEVDCNTQSPDEAWEKLCRIDPALKEAGYLQTTYPIRYGEHDQAAYRYRFYCIADDGSDLPGYKTAFMVKSNLLYPFTFDAYADGFSYIMQWVNPDAMSPACEIHGRAYLSAHGKYRSRLKSGSLLETRALEDATEEEWSRLIAIVDQVVQRKNSEKRPRRIRSK